MNQSNGYLDLLGNIALELESMNEFWLIAMAIADWRMRWLKDNPFA